MSVLSSPFLRPAVKSTPKLPLESGAPFMLHIALLLDES
jgi:hypothetical protein